MVTGPVLDLPDDLDDLAVPELRDHVTYHRPGEVTTACGQVPMSDVVRPLPGAWRVRREFFGSACPACYDPRRLAPRAAGRPETPRSG